MTEPPVGYRFLIQLVDAETKSAAINEINGMYGDGCIAVAIFVPGTIKDFCDTGGGPKGHPVAKGFTVYVPKWWNLP